MAQALRDEGHQGVQVAGTGAWGVRRIPLCQRVVYGTIPAKGVPPRLSPLAGGGGGADEGATWVKPGLAVRHMGDQRDNA